MINLIFANVAYASYDSFLANIGRLIINPLIVLLFALAVAFFLYGVFQFIVNAENEEKRTEGKSHMLWGIIGLVIMIGVWAILNVVLNTFNIEGINPEEGTVQLEEYNPSFKN
ncbi:MAG: hypothetical protein WC898_00995 [Candidatus Paceibacterota bacterium]|jgi:succinate dehydrogenase/fumarate reductase cytochrome b subunit